MKRMFNTRTYRKQLATLCCILSSFTFLYGQTNAIVQENLLPGNPQSEWDIPDETAGDLTIQGFATDISVNKGESVRFKINTDATAYTIDIYRLGYYNGNGARKVGTGTITASLPQIQPAPIEDINTGLIDCGNWSESAHWDVPSNAVSGVYIAKLKRLDNNGVSHIVFIVRDDASHSDLFFQTSDATWQAYNAYGGNSLYLGTTSFPNGHAAKVSYNRPFLTRDGGGGGGPAEDWLFNSEYPMIRFLERNGYDISYTTDVDDARRGNLILNHKIFLSVGHDEYWSAEQKANVEAARNAGVHLAFFGGNEVYWKTRWENSVDGSNTSYRTLVCYKEGTLGESACGGKCDPSTEWTGLWRDGCSYPGSGGCLPENALSGQISWDGTLGAITVPDTYKNLRFWRNTSIASLGAGQIATFPDETLGYEWDWEQYPSTSPPGRFTLSSTTVNEHTHKLSLYRHSSGALVFGAGTVQWAWGLDENHDRGNNPADADMQQATINLLADMGAQPTSLQGGLLPASASTDIQKPTSIITNPLNGSSLTQNSSVIITGTATDIGGTVAAIEVSVDGGNTWEAATGTSTWSFTWVPTTLGTVLIKVRAVDDSGNIESVGGNEGSPNTVTVTILAPATSSCPCSLFIPGQGPNTDPAANEIDLNDNNAPLELGVKFRSNLDGFITAIRFYKTPSDNALNTVNLWTIDGSLLGTASLTGTPTSGWNEVAFASPININANTTYVASYFSPTGYYPSTDLGFNTEVINGSLTGIATSDPDGPNGVYLYAFSSAFPTETYNASNYWVDVKFMPENNGPDVTPPLVSLTSPHINATNVNVHTYLTATFNEDINASSVNTGTFELKDPSNAIILASVEYNSSTRTATLIPSVALAYGTTYTVTLHGGNTDPRIKDLADNSLAADYVWTFTTDDQPAIPPDEGAGGPILVISGVSNPFSRYSVEILRAQGYNSFVAKDITQIRANPAELNNYDVVILGAIPLLSSDIAALTSWVNSGGTLISFRPEAGLLPLLGLDFTGNTLSNEYLLVNTDSGQPGNGIVNQTIQFHGTADLYSMQTGTINLATLYSSSSVATAYPAITSRSVGLNGGKAIAFTYDLPLSIVYTRQGNPAWAGMSRDNEPGPIRSDNLFFPDWIDFDKIAIPQADEQQHLLTNIILQSNMHRKPLPHLWFLPNGFKAAVVMTGDDHATGNTAGRFDEYLALGPNTPQDVADWKAVRSTSYLFNNTNLTNTQVATYQAQGFEIALHPNTNCANFTASSLNNVFTDQLSQLAAQFPSLSTPVTNRTHCMPWNDWSTHAKIEVAHGIRFDVNYYYWPGSWIQDRPGMFTGSGMPMRFADQDGTIIDCYQAPTQITDESDLDISNAINSLLDKAIGPEAYYGVFAMNMHNDQTINPGADAIIASAQSRNVPIVSSKQMLTWIDDRNNTVFGPISWNNSELSFTITTSAHNLQAMVPATSASGDLLTIKENGNTISFTIQTIKGINYAFFNATTNSYVAVYTNDGSLPVTLTDLKAIPKVRDIQLTWNTQSEQNNHGFEIERSVDNNVWENIGFVNGAGNSNIKNSYSFLDKNLSPKHYYYRLKQIDFDGNFTYSPIVSATIISKSGSTLNQNYPNPFRGETTIQYTLAERSKVNLTVFDMNGRILKVLVNSTKDVGTHAENFSSSQLPPGVYYYKIQTDTFTSVKKLVVQ